MEFCLFSTISILVGNNQCSFFKKYCIVGPSFSRAAIQSPLKSGVLTAKVCLETGLLLHLPGSSGNEKGRPISFQDINAEVGDVSKE